MDMNGHINNVTYLGWALETVPADVYLNYSLQEVLALITLSAMLSYPCALLLIPLCMAKRETRSACRLKLTTSLSAWLAKLWSHWAATSMGTPMVRASSGWSIAASACDQR